jgi:hypothetical protein
MQRLAFLLLLLASVAGCGRPGRLDASTDAAAVASIKQMSVGMTDEQKDAFYNDIVTAASPGAIQIFSVSAFNKDLQAFPPSSAAIFKSLHGLTAAEIHQKAEEERRQDEERADGK